MATNSKSQQAVRGSGENGSIGAGPEKFPRDSKFKGANRNPGNLFGDASPRTPDSAGASLSAGLACCEKFGDVDPMSLGMGNDESTGKPVGPQMGPVDNHGASAKPEWG